MDGPAITGDALSFGLNSLSRNDSFGGDEGVLAPVSTGGVDTTSIDFDSSVISLGSSPIGAMTGGASETISRSLMASVSFFSVTFSLFQRLLKTLWRLLPLL